LVIDIIVEVVGEQAAIDDGHGRRVA